MANWDKLFDRTDIIEEFYQLYSKAKENLLKNIQGIEDDERKEEFAENALMQILIIWYLQEKRFLNNNKSYLIDRFKGNASIGYGSYHNFLQGLFKIMMSEPTDGIYNDQTNLGKIVVTGTAPFINGEFKKVHIPDKVFYIDGETEFLKKTDPKNISIVPILNLFESRDWTEGNIDEYVLGAIYEKLMTQPIKKETGAYYTPEIITHNICKTAIETYIIDVVNNNEKIKKIYANFEQILAENDTDLLYFLFETLKKIKILDPAVGSAHFLESSMNVLLDIYIQIINKIKLLNVKKNLEIIASERNKIVKVNLLDKYDINQIKLLVKFFIILSRNIYGVDINPRAIKIAKARLFLSLAKHFDINEDYFIQFPNVHFNLRRGNSLIGYISHIKEEEKQTSLFDFTELDQKKSLKESISLVSDLKERLFEIGKIIGIKEDIIEKLDGLSSLLLKNKINSKDLKFLLRIKDKLIKILIASLNLFLPKF